MKRPTTKKVKKILLLLFAICIVFSLTVIAFISPLTKYMVEKYDERYTGRNISMDWAYVNPFTGYIYFKNLKIREFENDSIFISIKGLHANFSIAKLPFKTYEVTEITLTGPRILMVMDKKRFNFSDIIEKFTPDSASGKSENPLHLNLLKIKIVDGEFTYQEKATPVNYTVTKVNIESTGLFWDADTITAKFSFMSDTAEGFVEGNTTINTRNLNYRFAVLVKHFDLKLIAQYMKDLSNFGSFTAALDADVKATGNFLDGENIDAAGMLAVSDLHLGKSKEEDYMAFDKLKFSIIQLSPKNKKYLFDSVSLDHPYFKYERYDHLDNLQVMFGKEGSNISQANANPDRFNLVLEIGKYIKLLAKNFFSSNYKINQLSVSKGDFKYNDFTSMGKFSVDLNPLSVSADSIDKNRKRAEVVLVSGIQPYGNVNIKLSINPRDSSDFDIYYDVRKIPVSIFNPYMVTLTSFPLDRGTVELNGSWHVRNGYINSDNHLLIIDPRASRRIKNRETKWLPVPLLFSLIRDKGNVVDYEIPITGNLNDPKFHVIDVFFDLLTNAYVKPVSTPYRVTVRSTETEIENSLSLRWPMRESELLPSQKKFIRKMAEFLETHPEASISVYPQLYDERERECILFFESKKKYFLSTQPDKEYVFSESDSTFVNRMSIKDSFFIRYLDKQVNGALFFTVQDKCDRLIGQKFVNAKFSQLNKERAIAFNAYFKERKLMKQVMISNGKKVVPYNGFTFYRIVYKGEIPTYLNEAYRRMDEFNDEAPRQQFEKERKKILN